MEEPNSLHTTRFDKLKSMSSDKDSFDFHCPDCKSDDIRIIPIGVTIRPNNADNTDLEKEGRPYMIYLNNLPTLSQALRTTKKEDLMYVCNSCKSCSFIKEGIDRISLNQWIKNKFGDEELFLGSRV